MSWGGLRDFEPLGRSSRSHALPSESDKVWKKREMTIRLRRNELLFFAFPKAVGLGVSCDSDLPKPQFGMVGLSKLMGLVSQICTIWEFPVRRPNPREAPKEQPYL